MIDQFAHALCRSLCERCHALLELGSFTFEMLQHRFGDSDRYRMPHECAREKCNADLREGRITKLPLSAVKSIEKARLARDDADRHAAADDFTIGGHIRPNVEIRLRATGMHAEAGDHLVEDQRRAGLLR